MDKEKIKVWCETCHVWHEVSSWNEIFQLENWECSLDFESISDGEEIE